MKLLIARLSEPSTYAGLSGAAIILGMSMEQFTGYAQAIAGIFAFAAMFIGESKST